MSNFSGKFDLCDEISMLGFEEFKKRYKNNFYVGDEKIEFNELYQLVPYYTHIPVMSSNKVMYLSKDSWIDIEENKYGHMRMHDLYRKNLTNEIKKAIQKKSNYKMD